VLVVETMRALPAGFEQRLRPLLEQIESLTVKIEKADQTLEAATTGSGQRRTLHADS